MLHILFILVGAYFLYKLLEFCAELVVIILVVWGIVYCYQWLASLVADALAFIGLA